MKWLRFGDAVPHHPHLQRHWAGPCQTALNHLKFTQKATIDIQEWLEKASKSPFEAAKRIKSGALEL